MSLTGIYALFAVLDVPNHGFHEVFDITRMWTRVLCRPYGRGAVR